MLQQITCTSLSSDDKLAFENFDSLTPKFQSVFLSLSSNCFYTMWTKHVTLTLTFNLLTWIFASIFLFSSSICSWSQLVENFKSFIATNCEQNCHFSLDIWPKNPFIDLCRCLLSLSPVCIWSLSIENIFGYCITRMCGGTDRRSDSRL